MIRHMTGALNPLNCLPAGVDRYPASKAPGFQLKEQLRALSLCGLKVRLTIEKRFKALLKFDACHTRSLTLISINTSASFCRPLASRDITVPIGT